MTVTVQKTTFFSVWTRVIILDKSNDQDYFWCVINSSFRGRVSGFGHYLQVSDYSNNWPGCFLFLTVTGLTSLAICFLFTDPVQKAKPRCHCMPSAWKTRNWPVVILYSHIYYYSSLYYMCVSFNSDMRFRPLNLRKNLNPICPVTVPRKGFIVNFCAMFAKYRCSTLYH